MRAPFGVVPVHALGPVTAASIHHVVAGGDHCRVKVIAKATCAFAPNAGWTLVMSPVDLVRTDVHLGQPARAQHPRPLRSAPPPGEAEVLFRGPCALREA